MDKCIDSLDEARVFSTLDVSSGYWKIEMDDKDVDKTEFVTQHGLIRYTRMPFELKNVPATFQRAMDVIQASVKWQFGIVYIDDIIIISKLPQQYLKHTEKILRPLKKAGMTLKLKKCHFLCMSIDYLEHVIAPSKLQVARKTTEAIAALHYPATECQMRSILGLCNVHRRFVPGLA